MNPEEIKIEKGVPMPKDRRGAPKYPWKSMEIGDSFYSPIGVKGMSSIASMTGKNSGFKFSTRQEGTGTRVWRIA